MSDVLRIRHRDRRLLLEIRLIDANGEQDFAELARACSEGDGAALPALPARVLERLRASAPGTVLGPIENQGAWELYKVAGPENGARAARRGVPRTVPERERLEALREVPVLEAPSPERWKGIRERAPGPYLLRGLLDDAAPLRRWSPEYLAAVAGQREVLVEYGVRRISRPDPRVDARGPSRKPMPFDEALRAIEKGPVRGVSHYLSAVTLSRWLPELLADVRSAAPIDARPEFSAYLFAGGEGTGTALHYDLSDNYLTVVCGEKDVLLLPPGGLRALDVAPIWLPHCGTSRLGAQAIADYALGCPGAYRCRVTPGDTLFVPLNWWHSIENRGLCIAVARTHAWPLRSLVRWTQARLQLRYSFDAALAKRPAMRRLVERQTERWARAPD